jgi:predicted transcriptional regulator of viral defense system
MIKDIEVKKRVAEYAQNHYFNHSSNGGLRVKDVADVLKLKVNSVRGAFIALEKKGHIERISTGLYRWKKAA